MSASASRIPIVAKRGIYLPEAGLWLDPADRQECAFVSHAHSDHFAAHGTIICSKATAALIEARFYGQYTVEPHMFGRAWTFNDHRLMLLPAGHTLGSAQIHVTRLSDGATLLYTGDFKLRASRTSEPTRHAAADTLIMETTFGLPRFRFPSMTKLRNALTRFCRETLDDGEVPVLVGYALGKSQEILAQLVDGGFTFALHPSVFEMTEAYGAQEVKFPPYEKLTAETDVAGKVLIVPPSAARSQQLRRIRDRRLAMCTGWALTPGAKFRYQVDEVFPLSDHADYPDLLEYVKMVQPKLVLTTHGYAAEFARDLRERGFEAWSLGADDQMEFSFGLGGGGEDAPAEGEDDGEDEEETAAPDSGFGRFVATCDAVAAAPGRLRKIELLAGYFRSLQDAERTAVAARFFSGRAAATREEQKLVATGWAILRLALLNVSQVGVKRYRDIAASQNDAGRTAFLMLVHGAKTAPRAMELDDVTACVRRLIEARGPVAKSAVLETYFRQMTPVEGQYLVKILTGDMRIGLKDGLIEEALAAAFEADISAVREAHMLTGDLGQTARLAARAELHTATLQVFHPLRPMLASPEETSQAIWDRLAHRTGETDVEDEPGDAYAAANERETADAGPAAEASARHGEAEPSSGESALESARAFLRGSGGAVPPEPGGEIGLERLRSHARQLQLLRQWADREQRWFDPARLGQVLDQGGEHRIFLDPARPGRVWKHTAPDRCGFVLAEDESVNFSPKLATPVEYLERLAWQNALFGDDVVLEGLRKQGPGVCLVTSQPVVAGDVPEPDDMSHWLAERGFDLRGGAWVHPVAGVVWANAKPADFIRTGAGELVPVDAALQPLTDRLRTALGVSTEPASVWLEDKFDGIRAQLHKRGTRVDVFSRDLRSLAAEFPDVTAPAARLADDVVLDGEIIAFAEGKKLDFFALQKRLGRREPDLFMTEDVPVRFVTFDLLWHNGESLLSRPLHERRARLEALALHAPFERLQVVQAASALQIEATFLAARQRGNEGLIAKDPHSPYAAGRRGKSWLKLKKAFATLDVVVTKVEQGHGKRSHVLSDYTFAVRDDRTGALRTIGKAYSGLTDAEIEELTQHFVANTLEEGRRHRTVVPDVVLEIAFDSIQPSDRHDSGLALRFPRIKAIRRDKTPAEIDTLDTARQLAGLPPLG